MPTLPRFDPIEYLVKRRFPLLGIPPMAFRYSGRAEASSTWLQDAEAYRASLESKSDLEIARLVAEERCTEAEEQKRKAEAEEKKRFFNLPRAQADFDHYCKCSYWSIDEALALSFGKHPEVVNWKSISPFVQVSPFARQYSLRRDLATRAVVSKQLFERMHPTTFLSWARQTGIPIDEGLTSRAVASAISLQGWRDLYEELVAKRKQEVALEQQRLADLQAALCESQEKVAALEARFVEVANHQDERKPEKALGTRERENLQILAFLGAVKGYGYDPNRKNDAAGKIEADTDKLSLRFTDDRIRHHLAEGFSLLPGDWRARLGLKPNSAIR